SNINTILTGFLNNAAAMAESFSAALPIVWLGKAVAEGDIISLVLGLACLIVPFAIVYFVLSKTFIRTATTRRGAAKLRYVKKEAKVASPFAALFRRETARLLSSSSYIMNAAMGSIMSIVIAVLILVKGGELVSAMTVDGLEEIAGAVAALALCSMASITTISACSVSLEGKNLWIVKSMPVAAQTVLRSKLALHLAVSTPGILLAQISCIIVLRPSGLMVLWMLLLPQIFNLFMAVFGQWANLCHPKLDWQTEAQPVKQGAAIVIAMFGGMGMLIVPAIAGALLWNVLGGVDIVAAAATVIFAVLAVVLYKWCMGKGAEIFAKL
ncbi:MAG: hypothetical protein IJY96_06975, partial [Oscillospiraceae bacterium]|nr:hypothetical protein [Oscillospiraceae bacterium]